MKVSNLKHVMEQQGEVGERHYLYINLEKSRSSDNTYTLNATLMFLLEMERLIESAIWDIEEIVQDRDHTDPEDPGGVYGERNLAFGWIGYISTEYPFEGIRYEVYTDDLLEIFKTWYEEAKKIEAKYGKRPDVRF